MNISYRLQVTLLCIIYHLLDGFRAIESFSLGSDLRVGSKCAMQSITPESYNTYRYNEVSLPNESSY